MPTEPQPVTLARVVHRAVEICDASGVDAGLGELLVRFEDADEPVGDPGYARERLHEAVGSLDPEADDGAIQLAGAIAIYLAYRRDQVDDDPGDVIRLAVGAEFGGNPPPAVVQYMEASGIA